MNVVKSMCRVVAVVLLPMTVAAQSSTSGAIAGVVKDATGAVLPGVSVEASSPALIEKVRTVVTDGGGQYKILDLRPGVYAVTFSLQGFGTVKREGVELTTGFTANVNGDLKVGTLNETVTVTGASPLVDVQNVRTQSVISRQVLESLPTGKSLPAFAALTVGAVMSGAAGSPQDVGGNRSENYGEIVIHGGRTGDGKQMVDGMSYNTEVGSGGGASRFMRPSHTFIQEVTLTTSGLSAESPTGGVQENIVPREGGNKITVYAAATGANGSLQSSNLTDELHQRGLTTVGKLKKVYDVGGGIGGPVARDRLWFYAAQRHWASQEYYPSVFYNTTPNTVGPFVPDLSRQAFFSYPNRDTSARLTWQITSKQKLASNQIYQHNCQCHVTTTALTSGEALYDTEAYPQYLGQYTYSYPMTNRLIVEAGVSQHLSGLLIHPIDGTNQNATPMQELSSGLVYNNTRVGLGIQGFSNDFDKYGQNNGRAAVSYVTGSHAVKVGFSFQTGVSGKYNNYVPKNKDGWPLFYNFQNGRPAQVVQWASPHSAETKASQYAAFVQDQWTINHLTLNLGVRFDQIVGWVPDQTRPAGVFVPALHIDRIDNLPNFKDVDARIGVAYDVFGNGKTAVKANIGRYLQSMGAGFATALNPAFSMVQSATRNWNDAANNNLNPDCNFLNPAANGECGAINNVAFGTVRPNTTWDKLVTEGFGARPYNWQASASLQHELRAGLAMNVGYFRTWFGNFTVTDNVLVTPSDFTKFCYTVPADPRLPNGGGNQVCNQSDVVPAKFGLVQSVVTEASAFGEQKDVYDGVDATMSWRFGQGGMLMGGTNVGRKITECVAPDAPNPFCRQLQPWQTQLKLSGSYPLPWGLSINAVLQSIPGIPVGTGTQSVTSAALQPALGRPLSSGANGVKAVSLFSAVDLFEERLNQLDLRTSRKFTFGGWRMQASVDLYNVFNAATVLQSSPTYPASFLLPRQILGGRLVKFSAQVNF